MAKKQQHQAFLHKSKRTASKSSLDSVEQRRRGSNEEIGTLEPPLPEIKDTEDADRKKGLARLTKSLLEQHEAY